MKRIDTLWAALKVDPESGRETICTAMVNGNPVPLVTDDPMRIAWLKYQAGSVANLKGHAVRLVCLSDRAEVDTINPAVG